MESNKVVDEDEVEGALKTKALEGATSAANRAKAWIFMVQLFVEDLSNLCDGRSGFWQQAEILSILDGVVD